jgi:hypothetical protein
MSLKSIDALCTQTMVRHLPVSFEFGGKVVLGTCGARDTMTELMAGGVVNVQEFSILAPLANIDALEPKPAEKSIVLVSVDNDGIPCHENEAADGAVGKVRCRVTKIGRALAGLTYTLTTEQRG